MYSKARESSGQETKCIITQKLPNVIILDNISVMDAGTADFSLHFLCHLQFRFLILDTFEKCLNKKILLNLHFTAEFLIKGVER